ncbi:uncharacterized protein VTP21DRAFT_2751 [Calcarisporiella thermophila]|uniref:uncharacterized protein n=1 Tax=Calcarisporiella thermophila TaxID=911321 RepID=UPI00374459D5
MIDWSLVNLLLPFALPWLISKGIQYFRGRPKSAQRRRELTRADRCVSLMLILAALYELTCAFIWMPHNIFLEHGLPLNIHYDVLLKRAPEYASILERLRSMESRINYAQFGHDAIVNCNFCQSTTDYMLYILPLIGFVYVGSAIILGLATITPRKSGWRIYGVIALACAVFIEIYTFSNVDQRTIRNGGGQFLYSMMHRYRHLALAALFGWLWVFDSSNELTDVELALRISDIQEQVLSRLQTLSLHRSAVLHDTNLRKQYTEFYRRKEVEASVISNDPEYQEARGRALSKVDVEELMEQAETWLNDQEAKTQLPMQSTSGS